MTIHTFEEPKAIGETLDYTINLAKELAGRGPGGADDTISSVTWTVPSALTKAQEARTSTTCTVWLSGGTVGAYTIKASIVSAAGRTYVVHLKLTVKA